MRKVIGVLFALFLCTTIASSQGDHSVQVRKLERAWLDAYEKHDVKAMDAILGHDFLITFPDGSQQNRKQVLEMISGAPSGNRFSTVDVISRVYGDTVILTGKVITEFKRDGKTMTDESLYTDTYVRWNGKWKVVASHLSNAPKAKI